MNKVLKTIWNLLKIAVGVCVICGTFYFGYNFLSSKFRNPDVYYNDSFHNLPKDSMDVIVLGSSHAQYSFCHFRTVVGTLFGIHIEYFPPVFGQFRRVA